MYFIYQQLYFGLEIFLLNLPRMHKKLVSISFFKIAIAISLGILYNTNRSKRERTRLILTYQCLYIRFPPFLALVYVKSRFGFSKVVNYMLAAFLCAKLYSSEPLKRFAAVSSCKHKN